MMWVIDEGRYLGEHNTWNRAAQFADGLFETLIIKNGEILALQHHVNRMQSGCNILNLQVPEEGLVAVFERCKKTLLDESVLNDATLKVIARRADSARGYSYDNNQMVFTAFLSVASPLSDSYYKEGVELQYCQTQCSVQAQLAGLKHLNRLENVLARNELRSDVFEGLMFNAFGNLIEGTMSNVFFEKDGVLHTPLLDVSGVKGVMRDLVFEYCELNNIEVQECEMNKNNIAVFDSMFVCNSLIGVLPVKKIEQKIFTIGSVTKSVCTAWRGGELYE
jgi:4-amino-4-deoxychorismate lyase